GYAEYATWRPHLAYLRDPYGDPDMEMEIDGVGGVSILAKARVFRAGVHFPAFSFEKHAETEGFGKVGRAVASAQSPWVFRDADSFLRRWQSAWASLLLGCPTTPFGTFTSLALMISGTWR
ncbi:hypothetical protein IMZ48_16545, partial [Candidatus Bathyarchaeota archaeon]|nr:hypothetical protein [Candidatus Bathyarchaeota archaeon]